MYKQISRLKLRFQITNEILGNFSNKIASGAMSTEQLWDLPLPVLDRLAVDLETKYEASGRKSYIVKKSKKDKALKLALKIVVDIIDTKMEEKEAANNAAEIKAHNEKIYAQMAKNKDAELEGMDNKELKKLLK